MGLNDPNLYQSSSLPDSLAMTAFDEPLGEDEVLYTYLPPGDYYAPCPLTPDYLEHLVAIMPGAYVRRMKKSEVPPYDPHQEARIILAPPTA